MKLGFAEIGVIIVVALIIFGVVRMRQIGNNTAKEDKPPAKVRKQKNQEVAKGVRHQRLQILGIIFILVGILILLSNIIWARWIGEAPIWAIAIAAIGLVTIFIARRR
jgi:sterol desaturase/sphingolipid hydroxylase (fatty acid hydroxylase superfamily)